MQQYGVQAVHRTKLGEVRRALKNSDGLISGGGSLLQDATGLGSIPYYLGIMMLARWCGKPTFVYAQGIGPVNRKIFEAFIARVFKRAAYVSVRDEESAMLLRRYGVPPANVTVVPDPVMGLPASGSVGGEVQGAGNPREIEASGRDSRELENVASKRDSGESRGGLPAADAGAAEGADKPLVVGVSVRFWRSDRADLDRAAAALEALVGRCAVRLRFLPFHHGADEDASRYVMERLACSGVPAELAPAHDDPQQMLREVSRCALLIGMRLHSLIYAANQSVPLLGISYDPKIDQFLQRLGQRAVGTTESLDPDYMAQQASEILRNPEHWHHSCGAAISRLKQEAARPAQQIIDYIRIN